MGLLLAPKRPMARIARPPVLIGPLAEQLNGRPQVTVRQGTTMSVRTAGLHSSGPDTAGPWLELLEVVKD